MTSSSEEFIKKSIQDQFPNIDLSSSSPFYDLFVRFPTQTYLPQALALADSLALGNALDNTFIEEQMYDSLLRNWFFERIQNFNTLVQVDLIFDSPSNFSINPNTVFVIDDKNYAPQTQRTFSNVDFLPVIIQSETKYKIIIDLISQEASSESVVGLFTEVTPITSISGFVLGQVTGIRQLGKNAESNIDAYIRLKKELGIRNLINKRSIEAKLSEQFPNLVNYLYVAGFSESEQYRDVIKVSLPDYYIRIYFKTTQNLSLPVTTQFTHTETGVKYKLREAISINNTDPKWLVDIDLALVFLEVKVKPLQVTNLPKWVPDMSFDCPTLNPNTNYIATVTDIKILSEVKLRVGGHTDLYVSVPTERRQVSVFIPTDSNGVVDIPNYLKPVLKIHKVERIENNLILPIDIFNITDINPIDRFTADDSSKFFILPDALGLNVIVDITCAPSIQTIQNFVNNDFERIVGENIVTRFFNPIFTDITIVLEDETLQDSIRTQTVLFFSELVPGSELSVDFYIKYLMSNIPDLVLSKDQVIFFAQQLLPNGTSEILPVGDIITPIISEDLYVTTNNVIFLLQDINFESSLQSV